MNRLVILAALLFICFSSSFALAGQVFNLADLPADQDQARQRLAQWKNSGQLDLVPRPPATLVLVAPRFWQKLSLPEKAGVVRDCLFFTRSSSASGNCAALLFNRKNPAEELAWGNLLPGQIVIFK